MDETAELCHIGTGRAMHCITRITSTAPSRKEKQKEERIVFHLLHINSVSAEFSLLLLSYDIPPQGEGLLGLPPSGGRI